MYLNGSRLITVLKSFTIVGVGTFVDVNIFIVVMPVCILYGASFGEGQGAQDAATHVFGLKMSLAELAGFIVRIPILRMSIGAQ